MNDDLLSAFFAFVFGDASDLFQRLPLSVAAESFHQSAAPLLLSFL